ncbi:Putative sensory transduction regulator [Paucidesulfovibrio gracilis DSM 16080]|uniref:Putative sensory transduction regulator n=1 Tax=Paucidesulfovibrio gracilis DSM 16080 TaxID=1121449 RepID=A0A1T4WD49_9BACT|nr:YbjN domain-containing protein [Paucidesulfovibrio gracilis]SKA74611.1 Putative sensory transduction regulator [Paucidesulfovibrio gracilis DSM 16080]
MRQVKTHFTIMLALALCLGLFSGNCFAQSMYDGISGPEMQRILNNMGFSTELTRDDAGDPLINSSEDGLNFQVYFYNCTNDVCEAIQFYSGFTQTNNPSAESINEWNTTKRFGRAYRNNNGDSRVEMDALVTGGVTEQHIRNLASTWKIVLQQFAQHINW